MRQLTESEYYTIANALRAAADVYESDAGSWASVPRIAGQFSAQAVEARKLADEFEEHVP
jgi:hypothetical protein